MRRIVLPALAFAFVLPLTVQAQEEEEQPVWHILHYQVDWNRVDSLETLFETYSLPIAEEAKKMGDLLEYKWLIHTQGSEWNVVLMMKVRSWEAVQNSGIGAAYRELYPDEATREEINAAFNWAFGGGGHRDEFFREVGN